MTTTQALARLKSRQAALVTAAGRAAEAAEVRDQAVLAAQQTGATYAQIEQATGLSTTRVTQILRRARQN